jgi:hypothetical protein
MEKQAVAYAIKSAVSIKYVYIMNCDIPVTREAAAGLIRTVKELNSRVKVKFGSDYIGCLPPACASDENLRGLDLSEIVYKKL